MRTPLLSLRHLAPLLCLLLGAGCFRWAPLDGAALPSALDGRRMIRYVRTTPSLLTADEALPVEAVEVAHAQVEGGLLVGETRRGHHPVALPLVPDTRLEQRELSGAGHAGVVGAYVAGGLVSTLQTAVLALFTGFAWLAATHNFPGSG